MAERLLIIDDDARLAAMVSDYLSAAGFVVDRSLTGREGLAALERTAFDAIILDVMLPDIDGFELCRTIRAARQTPILMLTARGEEMDRIVGLELGADDYLPKPFSPRELQARLRAILRRGPLPAAERGRRRCASGGSTSIASRACCASAARRRRSPATSSTCSSRSPRTPGACSAANG